MTLMWNVEHDASGAPIANKRVTIALLAGNQPAYSDSQVSVESVGEVLTDENGRWEADLEPNISMVPAGTVYSALLRFRGGNYTHVFEAPDAPGDNWIGDNLAEVPGSLLTSALSLHAALTTEAHGGIVADDDPRLSDERVPVDLSVDQTKLSISLWEAIQEALSAPASGPAGGVLTGNYPNPLFAVDMATQLELDAIAEEVLEHSGTPHSLTPKYPGYTPSAVGLLYNGNGRNGTGTRTTGTALNTLIAGGAIFSGTDGVTIDQFDLNVVTAGAAGAIYRAGIWIVDNQSDPMKWATGVKYATLLEEILQGGAPFDTTTIGAKTRTPAAPIVIPPNTWFCVGGVSQVAVCQPTIGASAAIFSPMGQSNALTGLSSADSWLTMAGVSGALGDLIPTWPNINIGHGVGFRRSA